MYYSVVKKKKCTIVLYPSNNLIEGALINNITENVCWNTELLQYINDTAALLARDSVREMQPSKIGTLGLLLNSTGREGDAIWGKLWREAMDASIALRQETEGPPPMDWISNVTLNKFYFCLIQGNKSRQVETFHSQRFVAPTLFTDTEGHRQGACMDTVGLATGTCIWM